MSIKVFEVGPRDGLQNQSSIISTSDKVTYIHKLIEAGLQNIEVGAFVRPDMIPQLADSKNVIQGLNVPEGMQTSVLVPNMKGYDLAVENGMKEVAVFTAASETFNQKNINASIEESIERFIPILEQADKDDVKVRGYVSTCFVCPYEGEIAPEQVLPIIETLLDMGCYEVSIGDTIGKATAAQVAKLFSQTHNKALNGWLAGHFHDTYGKAIENVQAAMNLDIKTFDTSSGGLGGCPYAPGASGNLATEDLISYLHGKNIETGVDLSKLVQASKFIEDLVEQDLPSKVYQQYRSS